MYYIDSHCHLTDRRYENPSEIVDECFLQNVKLLVDVGWDEKSTSAAQKNAHKSENVYFAAGIHPSESLRICGEAVNEAENFIKNFLTDNRCIAVGEIGLDYHYDGTDKLKQKELFERQIALACSYNLPVIIHSRDASKDMLDILKANKNMLGGGLLMHCYSESAEQAKSYLDLGAYFAFGGVVTFKNSRKDDIVRAIPVDRLLAETDAPYMSPEPLRGKTNYPQNVIWVYKKLAAILNKDLSDIMVQFEQNFKNLFKKAN